ncbi:MAG: potassium channel family protein, partial [Roseateles sp.]
MHSPQHTGNTPLTSPLLPAGIGGGSNGEGNGRKDDLLNHCVDTTVATATPPSAMATPNLCIIQVTLTTLGYGDILPLSDMVRSMSILEAIMGQLYL